MSTLVMDWAPQPGDLLMLRVEQQFALIRPPAGWDLMGRWLRRREQLWSHEVQPGEGTTVTVQGLSGKATLSLLRNGELYRVAEA